MDHRPRVAVERESVVPRSARIIVFVAFIALFGLLSTVTPATASSTTTLYGDALGTSIYDYSWSARVRLAATGQVADGDYSARAAIDQWGALYLSVGDETPDGLAIPTDGVLEFSLYAQHWGTVLYLQAIGSDGEAGPVVQIAPVKQQWQHFSVSIDDLGGFDAISGVWWQNSTPRRKVIFVDNVTISTSGDEPNEVTGPRLMVSLDERLVETTVVDPNSGEDLVSSISYPHPISENVYGLNFAAPSLVDELDLPFNRWGGNATSRYNHETGSSVIGADWYFMTDPGTQGSDHTFEEDNEAIGAETLLTVPISDWVSKGSAPSCGYPLPEWGPMDDSQAHWLDADLLCGNGDRDGQSIAGDPTNTSKAVDETFVTRWVGELVAAHGSAAEGGVENYALDNEPNLWFETHSDTQDGPIRRNDLFERNIRYAAAIKAGDPTASVYGPVLWGAFTFFQTNEEFERGLRPPQVINLVQDYLATMREASDEVGTRLLDTLAVNFYDDRAYGTPVAPNYRLQAARSLWDPSWAPQDWWLVRDFNDGKGLAVIPRLRAQIDRFYPGTELAITEYSFGAMDTIYGGLAQADALGVFGQQGVDVATLWDPFNPELNADEPDFVDKPVYWAYRMYRNADGHGERFGDQALFAESSNYADVSIYAAERTADGAITVMLVNKTNEVQNSPLEVGGAAGSAKVFRYDRTDAGAIVELDEIDINAATTVALSPFSVTLLIIN